VRCDSRQPLQAIGSEFTGDNDDPGIRQARMKHNPEPLGWKLLKPAAFVARAIIPQFGSRTWSPERTVQ
jgi:hypothetical protein